MTRSRVPYRKPPRYPMRTMAIGATFAKSFGDRAKRDDFRGMVCQIGRETGKRFQCKTDGLTLSVMRIR